MNRKWQRRDFIKLMSRSGLALPVLPSLFAHSGQALAATAKRRFIVVFTAHGQVASHWYPQGDPPISQTTRDARIVKLTDIEGPISKVHGPWMDPFREKLTLVRGLDFIPMYEHYAHSPFKCLEGYGVRSQARVTLDQLIASSPNFSGSLPIKSLHLGIKGSPGNEDYVSYRKGPSGLPTPNIPIYSVESAVENIFGRRFSSPALKTMLEAEYSTILRSSILSSHDRMRLQNHLELLKEFQDVVCNIAPKIDISLPDEKHRLENYIKMIGAAVKCDLTRVAVLNITDSEDNKPFFRRPNGYTIHGMTHITNVPEVREIYLEVQQYHAQIMSALLAELNEVEDQETGATYLDNSLVLWICEQGVRASYVTEETAHGLSDMPVFMAGGLGGRFKTNQYIDYRTLGKKKRFLWEPSQPDLGSWCRPSTECSYEGGNWPDIGVPINRLMVTLMKQMGLNYEEWETPGEQGFGRYDRNYENQYDITDRRAQLTELLTKA